VGWFVLFLAPGATPINRLSAFLFVLRELKGFLPSIKAGVLEIIALGM
jgi:hypothetical protein